MKIFPKCQELWNTEVNYPQKTQGLPSFPGQPWCVERASVTIPFKNISGDTVETKPQGKCRRQSKMQNPCPSWGMACNLEGGTRDAQESMVYLSPIHNEGSVILQIWRFFPAHPQRMLWSDMCFYRASGCLSPESFSFLQEHALSLTRESVFLPLKVCHSPLLTLSHPRWRGRRAQHHHSPWSDNIPTCPRYRTRRTRRLGWKMN